jgi:hypothetical protein
MKIVLPAQTVPVDASYGVDPIWYEKFQQVVGSLNSGTVGQGLLATTATSGHGYMPTCAGAPTGVPVARAGYVPFVYDTTNNKLWIYSGAWRGVVVT